MNNEYIIVNKTKFLKIREELEKGSPHWNGIYISDYQMGQIDLIDKIITSQSTPLIPEIEKSIDYGIRKSFSSKKHSEVKQNYISNLKLDI